VSNIQLDFYKAVIGAKNLQKYMRYFLEADQLGKAPLSWHWPAFFVTVYWLLYRKMWLLALAVVISPALLVPSIALAEAVFGNAADIAIGFVYLTYFVAMFMLPPLYAHAAYYKHCKRIIAKAQKSSANPQLQIDELVKKGGTSPVVAALILVFVALTVLGILAAVALPAFHDYKTRAKLTDAMAFGRNAGELVGAYYAKNHSIPASLQDAGMEWTAGTVVKNVTVDAKNGVITLVLALPELDGMALLFVPSTAGNSVITWKCQSQDIPNRYLPDACRH
jgi:type II secretory pathway pseudopilin PulG